MDINTKFWVERTVIPANFQPRTGYAVGYHEASGIAVFFGGRLTSNNDLRNDVWHYDGQTFYQAQLGTSPARRANAAMCYHPPSQSLLMWAGENGAALADTWRYRPATQTISYESLGTGCAGSAGVPVLNAAAGSLPIAGQTFISNVTNTPFFASVFVALGFSNTQWNGVPLPRDMAYLGMPGCNVFTSLDAVYPTTNVFGVGVWSVRIPPSFRGATFYNQAVVFDPAANAAGLTLSNAAKITVGF